MTEINSTKIPDAALFEPDAAHALTVAFDDICHELNLPESATREREAIAVRIIELGRQGLLDPKLLSARILHEARSAE